MISIVRRTLIKLGGTVSATPPYKSEGFSSKSIMNHLLWTIGTIYQTTLDYQLHPNTSHIHPYMCG
ncbi:hypothetical protein KSY88_10035, partial [Collinsella aerofaciens]|uniref:hypothetical protein n=1 Tax=Collinsella aerofaciens TaxID=74426 RepID=UPI001C394D68